MEIPHRIARTGTVAAASLLLAGCGSIGIGGSTGGKATTGTGGAAARPSTPATGGAGAGAAAKPRTATLLKAVNRANLGRIVVDGGNRPLYRFDRDTAKPSATKCTATCVRTWPPVLWSAGIKVNGVSRALLGRVKRPDGGWQLTIGGQPMYRYAADTAPGLIKGQGKAGAWYVTAPTGRKAQPRTTTGGQNGGGGSGNGGGGG